MKISSRQRKGFSLIECVIAIGLVAVLLTTFMAIFGPAQQKINRALGVADSNRLVSTLENEMAIFRDEDLVICKYTFDSPDGNGQTSNAFEKAFQWVNDSNDPAKAMVVYQYHALPDDTNDDGTLKAIDTTDAADSNQLPGVDYITQTVARRIDNSRTDGFLEDELQPGVVVGDVYVARMTQLVRDPQDGLVIRFDTSASNNAGDNEIYSPAEKTGGTQAASSDVTEYDEPHIMLQVEFFQLPSNQFAFVSGGGTGGNGTWDFEGLGKPVAVQNIAVRR